MLSRDNTVHFSVVNHREVIIKSRKFRFHYSTVILCIVQRQNDDNLFFIYKLILQLLHMELKRKF